MALAGALCACLHVIAGFTNRSLRARVTTLLGVPYSMGQMSYDLRRLRMKGLINILRGADADVQLKRSRGIPAPTDLPARDDVLFTFGTGVSAGTTWPQVYDLAPWNDTGANPTSTQPGSTDPFGVLGGD